MYDRYYGLSGRPFQLTPDPRFYFESLTHRKALSYLGYGLAQGEGFIVITGEVGAGKSTLVAHLMSTIDKAQLTVANIVTTQLERNELVEMTAESFGVSTAGLDKAAVLKAIEGFLHAEARAGRRCLLIVDEVQNLPIDSLEELRMLSNFQLGASPLLQIFLLGQPEFRTLLRDLPELEQVRQRVIANHHLEAMGADEIEPYLIHRLQKVGWDGHRPRFTHEAIRLLYAQSGGVPRKLNTLANRAMLMGAVEESDIIDVVLIEAVLADLRGEPFDYEARIGERMDSELQALSTAEPAEFVIEGNHTERSAPIDTPERTVEPDPIESLDQREQPIQPEQPVIDAETVFQVDDQANVKAEPIEREFRPDILPMDDVARLAETGLPQAMKDAIEEQNLPNSNSVVEEVAGTASHSITVSADDFQMAVERIGGLERRVAEQQITIRRMLDMLVDWVEHDTNGQVTRPQGRAA